MQSLTDHDARCPSCGRRGSTSGWHSSTRIYREEASRHPGVRFVDTRELFSDRNGSYSAYLPGSDGQPVLVRRDDGIHLTEAGADRLVPTVMAAIRADVRLP